jgi:voltage-gated sodium channel
MVLLNAFVLGWMTFLSTDNPLFHTLHMIDMCILWIFVGEIGLRFLANRGHFFRSGWNIFDCCVIFSAFIPFSHPILRNMAQYLRILRLFYFVEISKKLHHIIRGLLKAFPGLISVIFLNISFYYIFAMVGVAFFGVSGIPEFSNLKESAETLFQILTMDDWHSLFLRTREIQPYAWVFFYSYFIVMVFIFVNLFIGVIVNALQSGESDLEKSDEKDTEKEILKELKEIRILLGANSHK